MATALTNSVEKPTDLRLDDGFSSSNRNQYALSPCNSPSHGYSRRTVTLGRKEMSFGKPKPYHPSDFTRVKRMNTFKCVVKRHHPPLKGKALSFNGPYDRRISDSETGDTRPLPSNNDSFAESDTPPEIQEVVMTFVAPLRSTSTISNASSDISNHDDSFPSIMSPPSSTNDMCSICREELNAGSPMVLFGDTRLHMKCFQCGKCHNPMGAMKEFLVQIDGTPLCSNCTPSCHTCRQKVFHNHVSVLKKNFHEECLACSRCKRVSVTEVVVVVVSS